MNYFGLRFDDSSFDINPFGMEREDMGSNCVASLIIGTVGLSMAFAESPPTPTPAEQVAQIQKSCAEAAPAIKQRQDAKSLYERLGKRGKIKTLAERILEAHTSNPRIGHMFSHVKKATFVRNVTDFLVMGTGGKATYKGKDMAAAHSNLHVTNEDFLSAGGDVQSVMKGMKYGDGEIQEVVCALASFIPVVVKQ